MVQAPSKPVTFDEFIAWLPEGSVERYELHRGAIVELPNPRGDHSEVAGFLTGSLGIAIRHAKLSYSIPKEGIVRSLESETAYKPDVIILDRQAISDEPRWERESIITKGQSVPLIIEVVSTNWQDDYARKLVDYEKLGIAEYWIVDYLGLGGRRYIGNPKQPTLSIYQLIDGEYELRQFRGEQRIESAIFPNLDLTAVAIFSAGQ